MGWIDPEGKRRCQSCGPGATGKRSADKLCEKRSAELLTGTYQTADKKSWKDFRQQYREKLLVGLVVRTRGQADTALAHFERIIKPGRVASITTQAVDEFVAARPKEPGQKKKSIVSPATVNHDLRHIKAVLRVAVEWQYLWKLPKFRMKKAPKKLPV